jgi:hypothetical protein
MQHWQAAFVIVPSHSTVNIGQNSQLLEYHLIEEEVVEELHCSGRSSIVQCAVRPGMLSLSPSLLTFAHDHLEF